MRAHLAADCAAVRRAGRTVPHPRRRACPRIQMQSDVNRPHPTHAFIPRPGTDGDTPARAAAAHAVAGEVLFGAPPWSLRHRCVDHQVRPSGCLPRDDADVRPPSQSARARRPLLPRVPAPACGQPWSRRWHGSQQAPPQCPGVRRARSHGDRRPGLVLDASMRGWPMHELSSPESPTARATLWRAPPCTDRGARPLASGVTAARGRQLR